jgi:hypothetical protein
VQLRRLLTRVELLKDRRCACREGYALPNLENAGHE